MRPTRIVLILFAGLVGLLAEPIRSQDRVRYYDENGTTYRETRRTVRQPVSKTQWHQHQRTVYKDQYVTEMRESQRTVHTPTTEYEWEPRVHHWWNPFGPSYIAYHQRSVTRWKTHVETVKTPHTVRRVVPETEVVQIPQRVLTFEDREVLDRVAVGPSLRSSAVVSQAAPAPAVPSGTVGGIHRIHNDLPRQALAPLDLTTPLRR